MKKFWTPLLKNKNFPFPFKQLIFLGLLAMFSCNSISWNSEEDEKQLVARVGDHYLYEEDVQNIFNKSNKLSVKDSVSFREKLIDNWIKEKLIFKKALQNLSNEAKDKEEKLQNYYESLIRYEYEQALINEQLDTSISHETIKNFYQKNPEQFQLKQDVLKIRYLVLPNNAPDQERVKSWFGQSSNQYLDSLYQYGRQFAKNFNLEDDKWYYYNEIKQELNLPESQQLFNQIKNNEVIEASKGSFNSLVYITDFKKAKKPAPLSLKKDEIRRMILNRRKIKLVQEMEQEVVNKGLAKKDVKRYD